MKKDTISPNEINKFTYCPYQFYYERMHGPEGIKEKNEEIYEELGLVDESQSNFIKGQEHHEEQAIIHQDKRESKEKGLTIFWIVFIASMLIIVACLAFLAVKFVL